MERKRVVIDQTGQKSRTQQHFKDDANINNIMRKYKATGILNLKAGEPVYGDFTDPMDFLEMQNTVKQTKDYFASLPSHVRAVMNNDPLIMVELLADKSEEALRACVDLGLKEKSVLEPFLPAPTVNPDPPVES